MKELVEEIELADQAGIDVFGAGEHHRQHEIFGHDRTLLQFRVGPLPHADIMRSIELFGTEVAPIVRAEVARRDRRARAAA